MDERNKVIVKLNNKTIESASSETKEPYNWYQEQAASLDDNEEPNEFERRSTNYDTLPKKRDKTYLKRVLLTASMAIMIGIGFGFFVLKMFVQIDDTKPTISNQETSAITEEEEDSSASNQEKTTVTLESITGYVVQAGLFSTTDKADEWKDKLVASGYDAFSWETSEGFRLFVNVYATKTEGEKLANELIDANLDGYVREWTTESKSIKLNNTEGEWIQQFSTLWKDTMKKTNKEAVVEEKKKWSNWLSSAPAPLSEYSSSIKKSGEKFVELLEKNTSGYRISTQLIQLWYLYDQTD
ncbi:Stage II sporulation protein B [Paraliobacillus sp. PM-2]|uniref:SPOR domain-containing protein n=1 Tax=Paraliobacillus sp. PM-2 TaxID=1462524 RepID=UPI00061C7A59|nr:SPOR domain-containing protein [Paraliobacillus sp. PM-2]CQR48010.1 Stage II sporulation protein B [Paraliobacillus sp. PM-2]